MKTKKQKAQEVLDGLLRPEDTTHGTLEIVLQMCKDAGLNELYTAVEPIYLQKKQEFIEYHRRKAREYSKAHPRRNGTRKKTSPDNTVPAIKEYTERQLGIIRGTVPYEETHGREYYGIRNVAVSRGDIDVISFCDTMITEKKEDSLERNRQRATERYHRLRNEPGSYYWRPPQTPKLTPWERSVLSGDTDIDKCPMERLERILDICRQNDDEDNARTAELWIRYKTNPLCVCRAQTKDEAIALLESMTWMPIIRPEAWSPK